MSQKLHLDIYISLTALAGVYWQAQGRDLVQWVVQVESLSTHDECQEGVHIQGEQQREEHYVHEEHYQGHF